MTSAHLQVPAQSIAEFCMRWKILEFALFGSVLRNDFGSGSDVDVVVTFEPGERWSLLDLTNMREQLSGLFGRPVDLVEEAALRNPYRRAAIHRSKQVVYAA